MVAGDAESAIDRAYGAADAGTHGAANHAANRSGDPAAFVATFMSALLSAANQALGMTGIGAGEQGQKEDGNGNCEPKRNGGWGDGRGLDFNVVHLGSLRRGANAPAGGILKRPCGQMVAR
jgi:hypothetical protein